MADALLQVDNVSKRFGGLLAVDKASFTAVRGSRRIGSFSHSGKRSYEKKEPLRIHIGSMTKFIQPLATSVLSRRAPTTRLIAANDAAPATPSTTTSSGLPRM